jgi:hypothetical protein
MEYWFLPILEAEHRQQNIYFGYYQNCICFYFLKIKDYNKIMELTI